MLSMDRNTRSGKEVACDTPIDRPITAGLAGGLLFTTLIVTVPWRHTFEKNNELVDANHPVDDAARGFVERCLHSMWQSKPLVGLHR